MLAKKNQEMTQISSMRSFINHFLGLHSYFFPSNIYDPNTRTIIDKRELPLPQSYLYLFNTLGGTDSRWSSLWFSRCWTYLLTGAYQPYGYAVFSLQCQDPDPIKKCPILASHIKIGVVFSSVVFPYSLLYCTIHFDVLIHLNPDTDFCLYPNLDPEPGPFSEKWTN